MSGFRSTWLVALRELRERSRSRAFRASMAVMVLAVTAMIVLPAVLSSGGSTGDVGLTGSIPTGLPGTIRAQADAAGITARLDRYDSVAAGQEALRQGDVDVLVVDARRLEWPRRADDKLKAIVTGAIQLVTVRERAAVAGVDPEALAALLTPVGVTNVEHSSVAGRTVGDETATVVMTGLLLLTISVYGGLVLSGVVEEKSSRVVEVLLARIPARSLLGGKVLGIGLLGLAQVAVTAVAALVAIAAVGTFDVPAIRGEVLAWSLVWFVLGYGLYATVFGALGSLASRPEDAQSVAGPATMVMVASYFAAFTMIAHADSTAARAISYIPTVAPLFMPGRIALATTAWWEPIVAAAIAVGTIVVLIRVGGRLYAGAILHGGPTLSLPEAWRAATARGAATTEVIPVRARLHDTRAWLSGRRTTMAPKEQTTHTRAVALLTGIGIVLGTVVAVLTADVIIGVIVGASFIALTVQTVKLWTGGDSRRPSHR